MSEQITKSTHLKRMTAKVRVFVILQSFVYGNDRDAVLCYSLQHKWVINSPGHCEGVADSTWIISSSTLGLKIPSIFTSICEKRRFANHYFNKSGEGGGISSHLHPFLHPPKLFERSYTFYRLS